MNNFILPAIFFPCCRCGKGDFRARLTSSSNFLPPRKFFMDPNKGKSWVPGPCCMLGAPNVSNVIPTIFHELGETHADAHLQTAVECVDLVRFLTLRFPFVWTHEEVTRRWEEFLHGPFEFIWRHFDSNGPGFSNWSTAMNNRTAMSHRGVQDFIIYSSNFICHFRRRTFGMTLMLYVCIRSCNSNITHISG